MYEKYFPCLENVYYRKKCMTNHIFYAYIDFFPALFMTNIQLTETGVCLGPGWGLYISSPEWRRSGAGQGRHRAFSSDRGMVVLFLLYLEKFFFIKTKAEPDPIKTSNGDLNNKDASFANISPFGAAYFPPQTSHFMEISDWWKAKVREGGLIHWILDTGYWILDTGYLMLYSGMQYTWMFTYTEY